MTHVEVERRPTTVDAASMRRTATAQIRKTPPKIGGAIVGSDALFLAVIFYADGRHIDRRFLRFDLGDGHGLLGCADNQLFRVNIDAWHVTAFRADIDGWQGAAFDVRAPEPTCKQEAYDHGKRHEDYNNRRPAAATLFDNRIPTSKINPATLPLGLCRLSNDQYVK